MSDSSINRSRSRTRNKRVSEQTSEKRAERLEQHRRRYAARSGNETPQERESRLLKTVLGSKETNLATFTPSLNLPLKYLISGFFLLLFTGEGSVTILWTVAKLHAFNSQTSSSSIFLCAILILSTQGPKPHLKSLHGFRLVPTMHCIILLTLARVGGAEGYCNLVFCLCVYEQRFLDNQQYCDFD